MEANWVIEAFDPQIKMRSGDGWLRIFDGQREVARVPWQGDRGEREAATESAKRLVKAVNERDDLIAALRALVEECDTCDGYDPNLEGTEHETIEAARAVIEKALA